MDSVGFLYAVTERLSLTPFSHLLHTQAQTSSFFVQLNPFKSDIPTYSRSLLYCIHTSASKEPGQTIRQQLKSARVPFISHIPPSPLPPNVCHIALSFQQLTRRGVTRVNEFRGKMQMTALCLSVKYRSVPGPAITLTPPHPRSHLTLPARTLQPYLSFLQLFSVSTPSVIPRISPTLGESHPPRDQHFLFPPLLPFLFSCLSPFSYISMQSPVSWHAVSLSRKPEGAIFRLFLVCSSSLADEGESSWKEIGKKIQSCKSERERERERVRDGITSGR